MKGIWDLMTDANEENNRKGITKQDFATATLMIDDKVKNLFEAHVQVLKGGNTNGKVTDESTLSFVEKSK